MELAPGGEEGNDCGDTCPMAQVLSCISTVSRFILRRPSLTD